MRIHEAIARADGAHSIIMNREGLLPDRQWAPPPTAPMCIRDIADLCDARGLAGVEVLDMGDLTTIVAECRNGDHLVMPFRASAMTADDMAAAIDALARMQAALVPLRPRGGP